jgi:hypothetical protein
MSKLYVNEVYAKGSSNKGLEIDSTGRVIMPVVPAWRVSKNAAQAVTTTAETAVTLDKSSGSNCFLNGGVTLSSNKITVPIAGIYQVNLNMRLDNITTGYIVSRILKNLDQSGQEESYHIQTTAGTYNTVTLTDVYEAEAGDEFSVSNLSNSDNSYTIASTLTFSGHLIG